MSNKIARIFNSLALCTTLAISSSVSAETLSCTEKYDLYTQAQISWQHDSSKLAAELLPEYVERLNQYRDIQLASIERHKHAVHTALKHFPEEVSTWGSINLWLELSPEQEEKLAKLSPEFKKASALYEELIAQPVKNDTKDFQFLFRKTALSSPEFMQLMEDFNTRSRELNTSPCDK
ncbi:hypothetical protein [Neptuniibacter sp.]|uniref:hypothetical protein n=1 Tax=Neptuniibacter sp. TaxID=1962643 RepID=UPI0026278EFF|nr:hypothetical protein [Neptuniibacter sp.]MCP4596119.1 hypothetical protein [Neptuniibacter sp.]